MYLSVGFVTLLITVTMGYSLRTGAHMTEVYAPLVDAAKEIKLEATLGHLRFEEVISGDEREDIASVWEHLDQSEWYAKAMLEGGQNPEGTLVPLEDPRLRRDIEEVLWKITDFRAIAEERFAAKEKAAIGTDIDQRFDAVFKDFLAQADRVEADIQLLMASELQRFRILQASLIAACVGLAVLAVIVLGRYDQGRTQALLALHESEERFRLLFENAPLGYHSLNANGDFIELNETWCKVLGYTKEEVLGRNFTEFIHPDCREVFKENFPKFKSMGHTLGVEFEMIKKDGTEILVSIDGKIGHKKDGSFKQTHCVLHDITDRKRAAEALRHERDFAESLIETAQAIVLVLDTEGRIIRFNRYMEELSGYRLREVQGKDWFETFLPRDDWGSIRDMFRRAVNDIQTRGNVNPIITRDGSAREIEWYDKTLKDVSGNVVGVLALGQDITDRKRAEEAARRAQEELLARREGEKELVEIELAKTREKLVNQTRLATIGQVAASIAHELRNPLGAARNAAYYLKRYIPTENPKLPEYLGIIDQEISAADRVIRNMIEMARSKEPVKESADLGSMLRKILDRLHPAEAVRCEISLEPDPFSVNADPSQLRQVMSNIMLNAIQVMDGIGDITVTARRNADYDTISVRDSGPGVAAEDRERVFEPLFTTKAKGTGLGLTICRQIIERHGGTIELLEHGGRGAAFCIRLPR